MSHRRNPTLDQHELIAFWRYHHPPIVGLRFRAHTVLYIEFHQDTPPYSMYAITLYLRGPAQSAGTHDLQ